MIRFARFLPVVAFAAVLSCAHIMPIASCATQLVVEVVQNDLSGSDWEGKVEHDIVTYGIGVVDCIVNAIIAEASGKVGANGAGDPKVEHAKAFRAKHADSTKGSGKVSACGVKTGGVTALKSPGDDTVPVPPSMFFLSDASTFSASDTGLYVTGESVITTWNSGAFDTSKAVTLAGNAKLLEEFMCSARSCSR